MDPRINFTIAHQAQLAHIHIFFDKLLQHDIPITKSLRKMFLTFLSKLGTDDVISEEDMMYLLNRITELKEMGILQEGANITFIESMIEDSGKNLKKMFGSVYIYQDIFKTLEQQNDDFIQNQQSPFIPVLKSGSMASVNKKKFDDVIENYKSNRDDQQYIIKAQIEIAYSYYKDAKKYLQKGSFNLALDSLDLADVKFEDILELPNAESQLENIHIKAYNNIPKLREKINRAIAEKLFGEFKQLDINAASETDIIEKLETIQSYLEEKEQKTPNDLLELSDLQRALAEKQIKLDEQESTNSAEQSLLNADKMILQYSLAPPPNPEDNSFDKVKARENILRASINILDLSPQIIRSHCFMAQNDLKNFLENGERRDWEAAKNHLNSAEYFLKGFFKTTIKNFAGNDEIVWQTKVFNELEQLIDGLKRQLYQHIPKQQNVSTSNVNISMFSVDKREESQSKFEKATDSKNPSADQEKILNRSRSTSPESSKEQADDEESEKQSDHQRISRNPKDT